MIQGDCGALLYNEHTFDHISVGFGVRNFEHLELGLQEMCRMLKTNNFGTIHSIKSYHIRWGYKLYVLKILISGNRGTYEYLPVSVLRFPAPVKFMQMVHETGLN